MPAGDLLTGHYQLEINGLLTGDTTNYGIVRIRGLVGLVYKEESYERAGADGYVPHREDRGPRLITVEYELFLAESTILANMQTLADAWAPLGDAADLELHGQNPGWNHWSCSGRPVGFDEDLSLMHFGIGRAIAEFKCSDPTITKNI